MSRPDRQWRVVVDVLIEERIYSSDIATHVAVVAAHTAQEALRQLVLTSTNHGRIVRIEVNELLPGTTS